MNRRGKPDGASKGTAHGPVLTRRLVAFAAPAAAIAAAAALAWFLLACSGGPPAGPRAVIVDQLSLTFPNPAFVQDATDTLEQAGYAVDYVGGEEVTVAFYRDLPKRDYDMLILRVHAARNYIEEELTDDTSLFTAEPYDETKYAEDQLNERLTIAYYQPGESEDGHLFFAIAPAFIESSMKGDFDGASVILMGCDVLRGAQLAEAFVRRGAGSVVGWDNSVSASHTDTATEHLLDSLLIGGLSVEDAVAETMEEVGPDPAFGAELVTYASGG